MKKSAIVILLLMLTGTVSAQQNFAIGPRLGYYKTIDAENGKMFYGAAARLKLGGALGVEGSIDFRREEYLGGDMSVKSWPVMVTGLIYPFPIAYGLIGAGWYNSKVEYEGLVVAVESETTQDFGWHFGVGLDLPIGARSHLIGDIRYVYIDYDFSEWPGDEKLDVDFYAITVGVFFGL